MISAFVELFFPKGCLSCRERVKTPYLFCEECLLAIELIDASERCSICFREKRRRFCAHVGRDSRFSHKGALFFEGFVTDVLLSDVPRHYKLLASYFFVQIEKLQWPSFAKVIPQKGWEKVGAYLSTFLDPCEEKRVLFIGEQEKSIELRAHFLSMECYLLTFW